MGKITIFEIILSEKNRWEFYIKKSTQNFSFLFLENNIPVELQTHIESAIVRLKAHWRLFIARKKYKDDIFLPVFVLVQFI